VVESIRALRIARAGAVKTRTAAINSLKAILITAPAPLREMLAGNGTTALVATCTRLRPGDDLTDATAGAKAALAAVAHCVTQLNQEIAAADARLATLAAAAAPATLKLTGIGPDHAGQLLVTVGANPDRLRGEAAFAHLCGVAPIPASSGKTKRHRLHRGGDRDANRACTWPSSSGCAIARATRSSQPAHRGGTVQTGHHAMPEALPGAGGVPHDQGRLRSPPPSLTFYRSIPLSWSARYPEPAGSRVVPTAARMASISFWSMVAVFSLRRSVYLMWTAR